MGWRLTRHPFIINKNMLRLKVIKEALSTLVGWKQSYNPKTAIEEGLTTTDSGMYYQDVHPMVTLDNIEAIMPDAYENKYPCWDIEADYEQGAKVRYIDSTYIAVSPVNGMSPDTEHSGWQKFNPLSDYVQEITDSAISRAIQKFSTKKQVERETTTLVKSESLVATPNRASAFITPSDKLVGFEFTPKKGVGISIKLDKLALQMTGATGVVKLYLFGTNSFEPIATFEVDIERAVSGFYWLDLEDVYLSVGQTYYICYHQRELPEYMRAVNAKRDWSKRPCGTCNQGNPRLWDEMIKYIRIRPFMAVTTADWIDNPVIPSVEDMCFEPTLSYGFNFTLNIACDLTDFIVEQKQAFASVLQLEVASDVLRAIALNPNVRVNRNQINGSKAELLYEIDGDTQGTRATGINALLKDAYKGLEINTQGIDRACLACNNKGIRYTQV